MRNAGQSDVDALCREIKRRDAANLLTVSDATALFEGVVTACERDRIGWSVPMTSVFDALELTRGQPMTDNEWGRVFADAFESIDMNARAKVRAGLGVPIQIVFKPLGHVKTSDMAITCELTSARFKVKASLSVSAKRRLLG